MQLAARFAPNGAVDLGTSPVPLAIPGVLTMLPGIYAYNGVAYDCSTEGLHRFWRFNVDTTNRIVYQSDVLAFLSALSWLCIHGVSDEALTNAQLEVRARTSKLRLRCGPTTSFARWLLAGQGVQTRTVRWLTMGAPNGYDDGHVSMEVRIGGQWRHADCNIGCVVRDAAGLHLSAREAMAALAADSAVIDPLAFDAPSETMPFAAGQFDLTGWMDIVFQRPGGVRTWMRRTHQALGIDDADGRTYWILPTGSEARASWVTGQSSLWTVLAPAAWHARFYPT